MVCDVLELAEFYASPKGEGAALALRRQVGKLWPDLRGQRVLGLGYALPVMAGLGGSGRPHSMLAMMPERQGVVPWQAGPPPRPGGRGAGNVSALVRPQHLPLRDAMLDKVLLLHGLEHSAHDTGMLREVWRVLAPGGTMIVVVPNRMSIWARMESTPFGHGTPYSRTQLARRLRGALFTPLDWRMALAMPPVRGLAAGRSLEITGTRFWPRLAGVHVVLAQKQMAAMMPSGGQRARLPRLVPATGGVPAGAASNLPSTSAQFEDGLGGEEIGMAQGKRA
ncbi:MAG: class I SAM-dependent methyltransferase [Alphaproteobacteria bacterium]